MVNLQNDIFSYIGRGSWNRVEVPTCITSSLNPTKKLRPYQEECFKYFVSYFEQYDKRKCNPNLLFHMATGSGKTLIMAGAILYLYTKGYRNFLFFVHLDTILTKTKENFINKNSNKYLFAPSIFIDNKEVEINQVKNFEEAREDCINICFTSIHKLHSDFTVPKENSITFRSFSERGVVLISDEAHHLNADTKKKNKLSTDEAINKYTWEEIVSRIHKAGNDRNEENILLEFTATEDFNNASIREKYEDKIIFDYSLKMFRRDGYSKEIVSIASDTNLLNRFLQALIMSEYKKHLFAKIKKQVKPVILFKSKTKTDNAKFYKESLAFLDNLSFPDLKGIIENAKDDLYQAIQYFYQQDNSFDNLISEIKQDFDIHHSCIIDTNQKEGELNDLIIKLNNLEDDDNKIRSIYAVDMLNEGWDVLNLFDIVRLYDTRDGKYVKGQYIPGTTTNNEAQLIGRGARYFPFKDPESNRSIYKRKYDLEPVNPLQIIEKLHYHCTRDSDYIREIRKALADRGAIDLDETYVEEKLKEDFKNTDLYKNGYIFVNKLVKEPAFTDITSISQLKGGHIIVRLHSGSMNQTILVNDEDIIEETQTSKYNQIPLNDLGKNVIRTAINKFKALKFSNLKKIYPKLSSIKQFINDPIYLGGLTIDLHNGKDELTQREKLFIAIEALKQIEPILSKEGIKRSGSKDFYPEPVKKIFTDHMLKVTTDIPDKQYGKSMQNSTDIRFSMDVNSAEWHAYNDCFGTSEEKFLVVCKV